MEILIAALAGLVINGLAALAKALKLPAKHVVLAAAVLIGIGYTAFTTYVPTDLQTSIVTFVATAMSTSWIVWEYVLPMLRKLGILPEQE